MQGRCHKTTRKKNEGMTNVELHQWSSLCKWHLWITLKKFSWKYSKHLIVQDSTKVGKQAEVMSSQNPALSFLSKNGRQPWITVWWLPTLLFSVAIFDFEDNTGKLKYSRQCWTHHQPARPRLIILLLGSKHFACEPHSIFRFGSTIVPEHPAIYIFPCQPDRSRFWKSTERSILFGSGLIIVVISLGSKVCSYEPNWTQRRKFKHSEGGLMYRRATHIATSMSESTDAFQKEATSTANNTNRCERFCWRKAHFVWTSSFTLRVHVFAIQSDQRRATSCCEAIRKHAHTWKCAILSKTLSPPYSSSHLLVTKIKSSWTQTCSHTLRLPQSFSHRTHSHFQRQWRSKRISLARPFSHCFMNGQD